MARKDLRNDSFYGAEELELLGEVADRGTLRGEPVPAIIQDSAKHFRMKLLHDLDESATQLTTEFRCRSNEISESVRALLGTRQATTEDVTSEQVEHDVPEPLVETSSEINENVESCEPLSCRERPMDTSSASLATDTLSASLANDTSSASLAKDTSSAKDSSPKEMEIWQCQKCRKEFRQNSVLGLLSHIAVHESVSCPCFIEDCSFVCKTASSVGDHLRNRHGFSAEQIKYHQPLLSRLMTQQRDKAKAKLNDYFPPSSCISSKARKTLKRAREESCSDQVADTSASVQLYR
ncbi:hypothetical protein QR680_011979 [Steinernema hermaphroditum]|uniref:Uncharacterized protein n=1 Tax=Steinernema hermaphroditum TaxID=289476 RepID=A0AA39LZP8_9BILA|nr:hypothetical protein QR680_011979 [Steinernema hermaphroditum]